MTRSLQISAWVCVTIAVALWCGPTLLRADLFNGDATQHIYWLYRYADPALFPNDLAARYFASDSVAPWGYRAIYFVLAHFADAQWISELVACVLLAFSLALAWKLGAAAAGDDDDRAAFALLAVVTAAVLLPQSDLVPPSGFQRTFALPTTLLCLWALVARRYVWVGVSWVLSALIYPIMIPVLGITAGLTFLGDLLRERRMPPMWQWNALLGVAAIAIVLLGSGTPVDIGPMVTYQQALAMPEFGPHGRQDLYGNGGWRSWFLHHRTGLGWSVWIVLAMAVAVAVTAALRERRLIPRAAWLMAAAGVGLWFLARLVMFHLYLPNRHSRMALAAFAIVAFAAAGYAIWRRIAMQPERRHRAALALAVAAPLAVAGALWPTAAQLWKRPVDQDLEQAYAFIRSLPKDTLVAAHPDLADVVPLRTQRSVLASTEESIAFMLGYHRQMMPRIDASLRAAYATTWSEAESALTPYGVNVILTAPRVWQETGYYPPLDALDRQLRARGARDGFALRSPPSDRVLFRSGETYVLSVRPKR